MTAARRLIGIGPPAVDLGEHAGAEDLGCRRSVVDHPLRPCPLVLAADA